MLGINRKLTCIAAVGGLVAWFSAPANATLMVWADIGGTTYSCADGDACDTNSSPDVLEIGNTTINSVDFSGIFSRSLFGSPNQLSNGSTNILNHSGATVDMTFLFSDTDFVGPVSTVEAADSGTFTGAGGSTISLAYYVDPTNAQGAESAGDTPGDPVDSFMHVADPGVD